MSVSNPTSFELNDPNWDPIYGYNKTDKKNADVGDAMSFGLLGLNARAGRETAVKTLEGLQGPEYSNKGYQYVGDFSPESYRTPEQIQAKQAQDSTEGRAAQLSALQQMKDAADQSIGSQAALGRYQAAQDASQFANSREQAIRQDSLAHGRVGSAADMISRQQAAQAAANQNLNAGLQNSQMAALQRLQSINNQSGAAGQLRGQDQSLAFKNADILNAANTANVGARNNTMNMNTQQRNNAQNQNLQARQAISGANVQRGDDIVDKKYAASSGKANAVANALGGFATGQQQQSAQQQSAGGQILSGILKAYGAGAAGEEIE